MTPFSARLTTRRVLAICSAPEDRASLRETLESSIWRLELAGTCAGGIAALRSHSCSVVIAQSELPDGSWRDLLAHRSLLAAPPLLVVSSHFADDRLWAEALNLGAHDVLSMPFRASEVNRVVNLAWRNWAEEYGLEQAPVSRALAATF